LGTITFNYHDVKFSLQDKLYLKSFLSRVFAEEGVRFKSLSYIFCNDAYLLKLNQDYLKHDTLTDILTFSLSNSPLDIVAEIYISIERVKENAETLKIPFSDELRRVMIHGILHLCGYSDESNKEKSEMRVKEDYYLSLF
jgi:rRNA maturation RNase YbeY